MDDRTILRSVSEEDAAEIFALIDANRQYLRQWLSWLDIQHSVEDTRGFIRSSMEREIEGIALITLIEYEGQLCGITGYNWIDEPNRACEIGYWLRQDRQGRGIVTRSCRALIRYAFDTLDLNRINMPVAVGNRKSRAIPERLGFKQDGVLRDAEWLYDHYVDHVLYTLLRREYEH